MAWMALISGIVVTVLSIFMPLSDHACAGMPLVLMLIGLIGLKVDKL